MEANESPKVLLDILPGAHQVFDESFLSRNGVTVKVCPGPGSGTCPLVDGHGCEKFEQAKGILFELNIDSEQHRAILDQYRSLAPDDVPIRVVVTPEQAERHAEALRDIEVWTQPPSAADLDGFVARIEATERSA